MTWDMRQVGPEKRKLLLTMISTFATKDKGIAGAVAFMQLKNTAYRAVCIDRAEKYIEMTITAIRNAADNPVGQDEEAICKWLNENINAKENS